MRIRKIIATSMIMLILSHGIFQIFIFKIFKANYRSEIIDMIEEGIPEEELVLFRFSKDDFVRGLTHVEWIEENEFRSDGNMYDVVKKEVKPDGVYLYCLYDEKESGLFANLDKILKRLIGENSERAKGLYNFANLLSEFYSKPDETEYNSFLSEKEIYFVNRQSKLLSGEHIPLTPPPRS